MRCYCVTQHGQPLTLLERPDPEPVGTEVVLRVTAVGICHSDLHIWEGHYDLGGSKRMNLADRGILPPITLGHEICGEVLAAGPDAEGPAPGSAVLVYPWIGCGTCKLCLRGEEHLCTAPRSLGVMRPGGFADRVLVPHPRYLMALGPHIDPALAAPLACAGVTTYSAIKKFGALVQQEPLVVIGAGGLGLMAIAVVQALGGRGVIAVDVDAGKRETAMAAGALCAIDARADDAAKQILRATGGGARAVLDLVGATASVTLAMNACARAGHIVVCGLMGGDLTLSLPLIPLRPITLQGSYVGTLQELQELVGLMQQGALRAIPVTRRPLAEADAALHDLAAGRVLGRTVLVP